MKRVLFFLIFQTALASCTNDPSGQHAPDAAADGAEKLTFVFECAGDFSFVARIEGDAAWLFLPGRTIKLPRATADAGSSYANGSDRFAHEGDTAVIETGMIRHSSCINNRGRAIWAHAKLNGVDFRATGNEPGWYLEIANGQDILLVTDYGNNRYRFDSSSMTSDPHSRATTYSAGTAKNQLEIRIEGIPCKDTMSGEAFPTSVSVQLDDRHLSGCGRALH